MLPHVVTSLCHGAFFGISAVMATGLVPGCVTLRSLV